MASYAAGSPVTVNFALTDPTGAPVVPSALAYTVADADGVALVPSTILTAPTSGGSVQIVVPSSANALSPGALASGRVVTLSMTTADGVLTQEAVYVIRAASGLVPFQTSFQTYANAMVVSSGMPDLTAFPAAARTDQELALGLAFRRLSAMAYVFSQPLPVADPQSYLFYGAWEQAPWADFGGLAWRRWWTNLLPEMWSQMTAEIFSHYPQAFRDGLMRAQIYEADAFMAKLGSGTLTPEAKREAGILSETIGESSMMFRSGKPTSSPVCLPAMREIRPYLNTSTVLTRT